MIDYLSNHFRYHTMNSWNRSTSYAANVKIHNLKFKTKEGRNRAYDLLNTDGAMDDVNFILHEFDESHDYQWQAGFNGRSGGYIVLYQGGRRPSEYKRVCYSCGQKNYRQESVKCGRCGSTNMHDYHGHETFSYPGRGLDMGEDFNEWSTDQLRSRVELVWNFDQMVKQCEAAFVEFCETHQAEEVEVMVRKKSMVATEIAS